VRGRSSTSRRPLAGEDESGTLELLLANPVSRRRVVLEKTFAVVAGVTVLALVTGVAIVGLGAAVDLGVPIGRVAGTCLGAMLFAALLGSIAMAVGAWTGSRSTALGLAAGLGVAGYLLNALSQLTSALEPLRYASPFYHASGVDPLVNGLPVANFAALALVILLAVVATVVAFDRRDLAA